MLPAAATDTQLRPGYISGVPHIFWLCCLALANSPSAVWEVTHGRQTAPPGGDLLILIPLFSKTPPSAAPLGARPQQKSPVLVGAVQ